MRRNTAARSTAASGRTARTRSGLLARMVGSRGSRDVPGRNVVPASLFPPPRLGRLERLGRWCRRHRWAVLAWWIVAVIGGTTAAGPVFDRLVAGTGSTAMESVSGIEVLSTLTDDDRAVFGMLSGVDARSAETRQVTLFTAGRLRGVRGVESVQTPYDLPDGRAPRNDAEAGPRGPLAEPQGGGLVIRVVLQPLPTADENAAAKAVSAILRDGETLLAAGQPAALVRIGGPTQLNQQINDAVREEIGRAERTAVLISGVVLILVFGGLIAATLPVLAAVVSVAVATVALLGLTLLTDLDANAVTVTSLLGLGLSIDYALLLVNRYREELRAGLGPEAAVGRAWATAGRTIVFSSLTVGSALIGMLFFGVPALSAIGLAGLAIAVISMLVALTLVAALLGMVAPWVQPARHASGLAARMDAGGGGGFARLASRVQRRPLLVAVITTAVLVSLAAPLLGTSARLDGLDTLPRSIEAVRVADDLTARYGLPGPATLSVLAGTDPATLDGWADRWRADPAVSGVRPAVAVSDRLSTVQLDTRGDPQGAEARGLLLRVRADRPPGTGSWVLGDVAVQQDLVRLIGERLPLAAGVSVLAMLVLLLLMTGSVVMPVKAVLMNVLSLAATWGVLTAVFQYGVGSAVFGTTTVDGFNPVILVVILAFAFGLSMDYEVFLLARIKEYVDSGVDSAAAVRLGLRSTGRVITSAALLMVVVFLCFAAGRVEVVQQLGLGLAVAIMVDALVIRCILVPATMTVLGRWNWWAPAFVRRLTARTGRTSGSLPRRAGHPGAYPSGPYPQGGHSPAASLARHAEPERRESPAPMAMVSTR